jgi:opacity protein-like surface antigen
MKALRKITFTAIALFAAAVFANGQGLYVNVGAGYNLSAGSQVLGYNTTDSDFEIVKGSFGKGVSFGLGLGYMFGEHVGAELAFSYLSGAKFEFTDDDGTFSGTTEAKGKMMRLTPALKITAGESFKPYAKFGLVVGIAPKIDVEGEETGPFGSSSTSEDKLSGGMSLGFMGAAGVDIKVSEMLSVFIELNSINQSWAPEKNEWSYTQTAAGITDEESGTVTFDDTDSGTDEDTGLKNYFTFSSFGIHAGVKLSFGGK